MVYAFLQRLHNITYQHRSQQYSTPLLHINSVPISASSNTIQVKVLQCNNGECKM